MQECVFVPRKGTEEEGDGYVMALLNSYKEMTNELALPMSLRAGLHGKWVDAGDVDGHPGPIGMSNGHI